MCKYFFDNFQRKCIFPDYCLFICLFYCLLFSSRFGIGQRQGFFFATFNVVLKNSKSNSTSHVLEGKEGKNLGPPFFGDGLRGYGGPN